MNRKIYREDKRESRDRDSFIGESIERARPPLAWEFPS